MVNLLLSAVAVLRGELFDLSSARAALLEVGALCWLDDVRGGATGGSCLRRLEVDVDIWSPAVTATGEARAVRDVIGEDWLWSE